MAGNWDREDPRGGSNQPYGDERERSSIFGGDGEGRTMRGAQGGHDRGFFARAGDEVRSWLGDDHSQRRSERDYREDDRGWGGLMGRSGQGEFGRAGSGPRREADKAEPWGGGDWAGSHDRGYERRSSGGEYRSGAGSDRHGQSHYGSEHGFGGFQGDYGGGQGQGGFGGQGDYRGGRQSFSGGGSYGGHRSQPAGGSSGWHQDDHYRSWRDRQIEQMDREYDEYCRECQQSFHTDFDSWRRGRQSQRGSELGTSASTGSSDTTGLTSGSAGATGAGETDTGSTASSRNTALLGTGDGSGASAGGGADAGETNATETTEKSGSTR